MHTCLICQTDSLGSKGMNLTSMLVLLIIVITGIPSVLHVYQVVWGALYEKSIYAKTGIYKK